MMGMEGNEKFRPIVPQKEEVEQVELWSKEEIQENLRKGTPIITETLIGFNLIADKIDI